MSSDIETTACESTEFDIGCSKRVQFHKYCTFVRVQKSQSRPRTSVTTQKSTKTLLKRKNGENPARSRSMHSRTSAPDHDHYSLTFIINNVLQAHSDPGSPPHVSLPNDYQAFVSSQSRLPRWSGVSFAERMRQLGATWKSMPSEEKSRSQRYL